MNLRVEGGVGAGSGIVPASGGCGGGRGRVCAGRRVGLRGRTRGFCSSTGSIDDSAKISSAPSRAPSLRCRSGTRDSASARSGSALFCCSNLPSLLAILPPTANSVTLLLSDSRSTRSRFGRLSTDSSSE